MTDTKSTLEKDAEFGDFYVDVSRSEKRVVRAAIKTYEQSGTYITLKLFKKFNDDYQFSQKLTLSAKEFDLLASNYKKIKSSAKHGEDDDQNEDKEESTLRPRKTRKVAEEDGCRIV